MAAACSGTPARSKQTLMDLAQAFMWALSLA